MRRAGAIAASPTNFKAVASPAARRRASAAIYAAAAIRCDPRLKTCQAESTAHEEVPHGAPSRSPPALRCVVGRNPSSRCAPTTVAASTAVRRMRRRWPERVPAVSGRLRRCAQGAFDVRRRKRPRGRHRKSGRRWRQADARQTADVDREPAGALLQVREIAASSRG